MLILLLGPVSTKNLELQVDSLSPMEWSLRTIVVIATTTSRGLTYVRSVNPLMLKVVLSRLTILMRSCWQKHN